MRFRLLIFIHFIGFSLAAGPLMAQFVAKEGVMDLRHWQITQEEELHLDGEWRFFWQEFVDPKNPASLGDGILVPVPSDWNEYNLEGISNKGYASYRLKLRLPEEGPALALRLFQLQSAYRLYANGELIGQSGVVAQTEALAVPYIRTLIHNLPQDSNEVELILHVSSYHNFQSGLRYEIHIGDAVALERALYLEEVIELLLIGGMGLICLLFFGVFLFRKQDLANLYFALFCLCVDLRLFALSGHILAGDLFYVSWETAGSLVYVSFFSGLGVFALYLSKLYPEEFPKVALKFILPISFGAALFAALAKSYYYSLIIPVFGIVTLVSMIFYLGVFVWAWRARRPGAMIGFLGSIVLFLAISNDILYDIGLLQTGFYNHYFFVFFLFSQALILGLRLDKATFQIQGLEKEMNEKNQALARIRNEVLAHGSEDVSTPLQTIMGISESLLSEDKISGSAKEGLRKIHLSSLRLRSVIADILDILQTDQHQLELHIDELDLCFQVTEAFYQVSLFDPQNPIQMDNYVSSLIPKVLADQFRLQQVLLHLLENTLKLSDEGTIRIMARELEGRVHLELLHLGSGALQEITGQLLRQGVLVGREELVQKLGLSVPRAIMEAMQGHLGVDYSEEQGITYWLELPIAPAQEVLEITPIEEEEGFHGVAGAQVLVVDDDRLSFDMMKKALAQEDYQLDYASNGLTGMDKLEEAEPDLVIVDLMMPWMSGFEFLQKIRQQYDVERLPILVITAMDNHKDYLTSMELGANDFIRKPFQKAELIHKIRGLMRIRKAFILSESLSQNRGEKEELITAKIRLSQLIEHSLNGLILMDSEQNITFINQVAASFFDLEASRLKGMSFQELLTEKVKIEINKDMTLTTKAGQRDLNFSFISIEDEEETSLVAIVSESLLIRKNDLKNGDRDQPTPPDFHSVVRNLVTAAHKGGNSVVQYMKELERSMDEVSEDIKYQESRKALVEVMSAAVSVWEEVTGTSKVELAEESEIWKVYLDRGVYRTRTMDKYLTLEALPSKPRWRDVIRTAEFVIKHKSAKHHDLSFLKESMEKFASLSGF